MRHVLFTIGVFSLAIGFAGIFIPLLPTTPFVLLAAWCFMRSSPRFHNWLMTHPTLGPMVTNWQREGSIPRVAKAIAVASISVSLAAIWWRVRIFEVKVGVSILLAAVAVFILTRPTARSKN